MGLPEVSGTEIKSIQEPKPLNGANKTIIRLGHDAIFPELSPSLSVIQLYLSNAIGIFSCHGQR